MSDEQRPTDYHLDSIRCALVREYAGGVKAADSHLLERAIGALLKRGMSEEQIAAAYREKFPE